MIKLKQAVVVEGRYDKIKLQSVVEAIVIVTNGFGIFKDQEKLNLIKNYAQKTGVVILTDADHSGFMIRNKLKGELSNIPGAKVYHVYIPDIFGKERRKDKPTNEGKLGVEGMSVQVLQEAFAKANLTFEENLSSSEKIFTKEMFFDDGFIGKDNSSELRKKLARALKLSENISTNALIDALNAFYTIEEYKKIIKFINY